MEFVVITFTTLFVKLPDIEDDPKANYDNLTLALNYNLLAVSEDDIDETYERMYDAFMGNIGPNVSAVLVSATKKADLVRYELEKRDEYRSQIYHILYKEGKAYSCSVYDDIGVLRLQHLWNSYEPEFVQDNLIGI